MRKFPHVLVVEASAGSGKTLALAKRYLKLLMDPSLGPEKISLRSILAITFTNKATFEMKERILELLKRIALGSFERPRQKEDILGLLGLPEEKAKFAARNILEEIVRHYNFFQVQTIDSFINGLLLGSALNIERSASFKIKRDYQNYLAYCLDSLIEQAPADKEILRLLEEFLEHYLFVENRQGWFPKEDILGLVHSLFTLSNKFGGLFKNYPGKGSDVIKAKKHIYLLLKELSSQFPKGMNASSSQAILNFLAKSQEIFDFAQLPQGLNQPEPPMNKNNVCPAEFLKNWKKIYRELVALSELDATVAYNPYVNLFGKLLDFFQLLSKKEDLLFLEELNWKARLLFDHEGLTVAEAYYRLAAHFKHYLIDEFQDTSVLQWRNLELMVEDALSSGGSLFYVGDKKQAIYRFRGGEVSLFDEIKNKFSRYNVIPEKLARNFRSQKEIIEFNNKIFSRDNLTQALQLSGIKDELPGGTDDILEIFKDAAQTGNPENRFGYVALERLEEKNQEERNQIMQPKIINLIKDLRRRHFQYEDIALLTRDNSEVERLSLWLLSAGIPVESEKTLNVLENPFIKEIICFLKFLHSPIDDLSFAGFILGEIFPQLSGSSQETIRQFVFTANSKVEPRDTSYLYRKFAKQYPHIWKKYLQEFYQNVGFVSVYELVLSIYSRFDILNRFSNQQAFFMKFLELIKQSEEECAGMEEFLDYLKNASPDDLYVTITHSDSVKILTVHKSKGLEFPIVIIPFLKMEIKPETGAKGTNSYVWPDRGDNLGLVRITKNQRLFSKKLQAIYAQSYKKACIDELNNIYVALTRPQYELYIFIPKKSGTGSNKAAYFIPEGLTKLGSQREYSRLSTLSQPMIKIPPQIYSDWIKLLKQEEVTKNELVNREKIIEGNIAHALLSRIDNCWQKDTKPMIEAAVSDTQRLYPFVQDFSIYTAKIEKLLSHHKLKNIFYVPDGDVHCEKEIVDASGNLKRVDRLIVREKEVAVIDYKTTAKAESAQREQIKEYLKIFAAIYPQKRLKGFLVYLDDFSLEEISLDV